MYELETYQALQAGDFELHYLPTVRLVDRRCVGAEALIRWKRDGAWVPPMEFIPNTERTPLAGLITYWVIDTVGVELKHWLSVHPGAHVSINIPPDVLGRGGIEYAMNKAGLHDVRQQIVFEVTERGVPDAQGLLALDHMAKGGMRIALDDVHLSGTNLALLSRCHFELLKIDQVARARAAAASAGADLAARAARNPCRDSGAGGGRGRRERAPACGADGSRHRDGPGPPVLRSAARSAVHRLLCRKRRARLTLLDQTSR